MPKPHFPRQGGPHKPAFQTRSNAEIRFDLERQRASTLAGTPASTPEAKSGTPRHEATAPSVQEYRDGPAAQRVPAPPSVPASSQQYSSAAPAPNAGIMWIALAVCGLALLFTIFAVLHHG